MDLKKIVNPTDENLIVLAIILIFIVFVINLPESVIYPQDNYTNDITVQNKNAGFYVKKIVVAIKNINSDNIVSYIKNAGPTIWPSKPMAGWLVFIVFSFILFRIAMLIVKYISSYVDDFLLNWWFKRRR